MAFQIYFSLVLVTSSSIALGAVNHSPQRIIGGGQTLIERHPYLVSIRKWNQHFCGGSIITERHILSAAHCIPEFIEYPFTDNTVVSGSDKLEEGGETHFIKNAFHHSEYEPNSIKHDISILLLTDKIHFNSRQKPIPLPSVAFKDGAPAVTAGFGSWNQYLKKNSPYLKALKTNIVHYEKCPLYNIQGATLGQICGTQPQNQGTCQGDSGGPLVSDGKVVGIVSHGTIGTCGLTPDIYTDVLYYRDFIDEVMLNYQ